MTCSGLRGLEAVTTAAVCQHIKELFRNAESTKPAQDTVDGRGALLHNQDGGEDEDRDGYGFETDPTLPPASGDFRQAGPGTGNGDGWRLRAGLLELGSLR